MGVALAGFVIWLTLLAAAGMCMPTRPRTSGALFILLGIWSFVLRLAAGGDVRPVPWLAALGIGVFWIALGIRYLLKRPA
jgi:hypothetical protein